MASSLEGNKPFLALLRSCLLVACIRLNTPPAVEKPMYIQCHALLLSPVDYTVAFFFFLIQVCGILPVSLSPWSGTIRVEDSYIKI